MDDKKILLVDDDPGMIQAMARILAGTGRVRFATSGQAALKQMRDAPPDLVLLDAEMPGMSGYEVCEAMKADLELVDIPVIFVTGHSDQVSELKGLEVGAVDFLSKPISEPLLLARVRTQLRMKHLSDELRRIGTTDALTETMNRRAFDTTLQQEWKRCWRSGEPISLLMIDVDHFKLFNDRYGHPAGDACLRTVALALKHAMQRPADGVARYGGEEFAIILPQTPRAGAGFMAHRLLDAVEVIGIPHGSSPTAGHVTVSIGIGCFDEDSAGWSPAGDRAHFGSSEGQSASPLLKAADQALYAAKGAGRAQAWWLDAHDSDAMDRAREVELPARAGVGAST